MRRNPSWQRWYKNTLIDGCWAAFYTDRFAAGRTADGVPCCPRRKTCWNCACFGEAGELWLCAAAWGRRSAGGWLWTAGDYLTETQLLDICRAGWRQHNVHRRRHYTLPADKDDALLLHDILTTTPKTDGLCGRHPFGWALQRGNNKCKRRKPLQLCAAGHRARPHLAGRLLYRPAADRAAGLHLTTDTRRCSHPRHSQDRAGRAGRGP